MIAVDAAAGRYSLPGRWQMEDPMCWEIYMVPRCYQCRSACDGTNGITTPIYLLGRPADSVMGVRRLRFNFREPRGGR
jgi:hypothetical protein